MLLVFSAYLFSIVIYGFITSPNMAKDLMCFKLIPNSPIKRKYYLNFVIAIAATEIAIRLTIVSSIYRNIKSTNIK
uniref:Uncharacterized protein n=1 Tax=Manihot esculenta TaxID=3983 RepID=A0A199UBC5_MANES